jgi:asparagine synthase (glutamine-hydrolysing)
VGNNRIIEIDLSTHKIKEKMYQKKVKVRKDKSLRDILVNSTNKKLMNGDILEQGFFLSGGLDSSLVAGIASKFVYPKKIRTFAIGFSLESEDIKQAQKVANYIGSIHNAVIIDKHETGKELENIIKVVGSYDQTTIRASSILYMGTKYIKENYPEIKVMFTGEFADELFGSYIYMKDAPSDLEFEKERQHLLENVHNFDGQRCDRVCSNFGIESRYPFFSKKMLSYLNNLEIGDLNPKDGIEKRLLRDSFRGKGYIPEETINRQKEALSDGTSHKSDNYREYIKEYASKEVTRIEYSNRHIEYPFNTPTTREDYLYRKIFKKMYPNELFSKTIPYKWLPKWQNGELTESSAQVLDSYKLKQN